MGLSTLLAVAGMLLMFIGIVSLIVSKRRKELVLVDGRWLPLPPGPPARVRSADTACFLQDRTSWTARRLRRYGTVFRAQLFGEDTVVVCEPHHVRKLLLGEHDLVEDDWPAAGRALLGPDSLANTYHADHLRLRRTLAPAFAPKAIADYTPRMAAIAEQYCSAWAQEGHIMGFEAVKAFTFEVMVDVVLGLKSSLLDPSLRQTMHTLFRTWADAFMTTGQGPVFDKGMEARKELLSMIDACLSRIQADPEGSLLPGKVKSTGQLLLEAKDEEGRRLSRPQLLVHMSRLHAHATMPQQPSLHLTVAASVDRRQCWCTHEHGPRQLALPFGNASAVQCVCVCVCAGEHGLLGQDNFLLLMFAGYDTSSSALTLLMSELARRPEVIAQLRKEQEEVVAEHGAEFSTAAVSAMDFADATVRELLRWRSIATGVNRRTLQALEVTGFGIPKGTRLIVGLQAAMNSDARWAAAARGEAELDPARFAPRRWLLDGGGARSGGKPRAAGLWVPFAGGARECLGYVLALAEMKVMVAVLARGYEWALDDPQEPFGLALFHFPTKGAPMTFRRLAAVAGAPETGAHAPASAAPDDKVASESAPGPVNNTCKAKGE